MALFVLLLAASVAGGLAAVLAARWPAAAPGATAAPAEAAARHAGVRRWLRARGDPAAATGLLLTLAALAAVAGGALVAVVAYLVRQVDALRRVDAWAARWGHDHATDAGEAAITAVTQLGETWFVVVAGLVVAALEWRRGSSRLVVPFLVVVVLGDKLITTAIKELADRARPTLDPIAETLGPSFPSGHSSTAAAFFAGAALVVGRAWPPRARAALAGVAVSLAVAVVASRVLLGVHWLSDVVAGLALGWGWFALCSIAFGGRMLRFGATAERVEAAADPRAAG
jgi:membrane-associated phospholipid phosphatase